MSARQLGKIQVLRKQLQEVDGHPRTIKQLSVFICVHPDTGYKGKLQTTNILNTLRLPYPDLQTF